MPDVGDYTTPQLAVTPFDGTTVAALTVHAPDGTSSTPTASSTDGGAHWTTTAVSFTQAGWWLLTWVVTGTGAGTEFERIYVTPAPTGPAWAPDLVAVAKYVPRRTVIAAANGYGTPQNTFSSETHPSAAQVEALIADAVAWVQVRVGVGSADISAGLYGAATRSAALWAAGMVEATWPDNRDDLSTAQLLLEQAKVAREELWAANVATTGTDVEDPSANLMPMWSFPRPDPWGDTIFT